MLWAGKSLSKDLMCEKLMSVGGCKQMPAIMRPIPGVDGCGCHCVWVGLLVMIAVGGC